MPAGSSYSAVKAALVAKLQARPGLSAVAVSYEVPKDPMNVKGPTGANEAIWLDDAEGDDDVVIFGGLPLVFDETYTLALTIQVLRPTTGAEGEQQAADTRADELLYEVLSELASDTSLGVVGFDLVQVTPSAWRRKTGVLSTSNGHAAGIELDLSVNARISFD